MTSRMICALLLACAVNALPAPFSTNANRLTYLDGADPFHAGRDFPKLTTPQWAGDPGVEAVVILAIDDMRSNEGRYETMLRPILERLKKIDGRAPVSIMVNTFSPSNAPLLQSWLKEGVSLECHTIAHPCPLCQRGDFDAAATNYHSCVDLLGSIPGSKPVAFRMPCCDSMNSPTPRFYSEIFNQTTAAGNFLTIDSSVMVLLTTNDSALPRDLVVDEQGRNRFRKYLPSETNAVTKLSMGSFTTTIDDYPYPYVVGNVCWELPCIVPSDWEANNFHSPTNAATVEDWERALDAVVLKQGTMTFIFHPHGWIRNEQMVQFIDYADKRYGRRVKFLNFRKAQQRLDKNLLAGRPLRAPTNDGAGNGADQGVRLIDVNNDGYMDVVSPAGTRVWNPVARTWSDSGFPAGRELQAGGVHFGVLTADGNAACLVERAGSPAAYRFADGAWREDKALVAGARTINSDNVLAPAGRDRGVRLRDIDNDGICELLVSNDKENAALKWNAASNTWTPLPFGLPEGTRIVDALGHDAGLRFADVDGDGYDDVIFSDAERFSLHLFRKDDRKLRLKPGWSDEILSGTRVNPLTDPLPPIVRAGAHPDNGVWFARSTMWIQNEDTAHLPDRVDRRGFHQLLTGYLPPPLSPGDALKSIRVHPGFKVELVASEPLIADPIAFEWGADGRLWVVEMGDYPLGTDGKGTPGGRVVVLEDTDGDGRYDKATTFLEGLNFPTGLYPWRNGVVISGAPDIIYAEDTNGDGKADLREVLFTGFAEGNQQHRVNGFDYGLDGWLYAANGDSGGSARPAGTPGSVAPLALRGHDVRLHPDKRRIETVAGQTQYGRHRDDWGNWLGNNNPNWLWHYYFPEHYLARNPLLPVKTLKKMLANYPDSSRCYPLSRTMARFNDPFAANHVTSGCTPMPYRDSLMGSAFAHAILSCEPVHNLVHCEILEPDGVTFSSHRVNGETNSEFLASNDNWFRPVYSKTGPDGAIYVADMYRLVIEHPEWIPAEMQRRLDLRAGSDKGRIYRISPEGATLRPIPNLARLSGTALAAALDSQNGWQRDTVQRLLTERQDRSAAPQLEKLAASATSPKVRLQALWTLHGLGVLRVDTLAAALKDADPHVRENAVRVSEAMLPDVLPALLSLVGDPSARVRYQLAFSLGETSDRRAVDALLALGRDSDENIRNAVLSSAPRHATNMLAALAKLPASDPAQFALPMVKKLVANPPSLARAHSLIERTNVISAADRAARAAVVARYADVPKLSGSSTSGRTLFEQNCAQCHRLRGLGNEVGPDLGIMGGKAPEQVVIAIMDPNAAVEDRFRSYSVSTKDGRDLTGIIVAETPTTLTLRAPNQPDETLLRGEITEMTASGLSLMPEGFEHAFTPQQLADVVAFVLGK